MYNIIYLCIINIFAHKTSFSYIIENRSGIYTTDE